MPCYVRSAAAQTPQNVIAMIESQTGNDRLTLESLKWGPNCFWDMVPIGIPTPTIPAMLASMPANIVLMDGQVIADAASPLNGQTIPKWNDDVYLMGSAAATGAVTGQNDDFITTDNLPTGDFSVTVGTSSAGTPAGSVGITAASAGTPAGSVTVTDASAGTPAGGVTIGAGGAHSHQYDKAGANPVNASILALGSPVVQNLSITSTATDTAATHTHTATFSGSALAAHGHAASFTGAGLSAHGHAASFTGSALAAHGHTASMKLNAGTQTKFSRKPKSASVAWVIRIK